MGKNKWFFIVFTVLFSCKTFGQADSTKIGRGFVNYFEATDSLIARLIASKPGNIEDYLITKSQFVAAVRLKDSTTPENFVVGIYYGYESKIRKSFKKLHKKIRGKPFYIKTSKRDSIYLYSNTGDPSLHRIEVHFKRKKTEYYIKYQLWKINGLWYFYDKFMLETEE